MSSTTPELSPSSKRTGGTVQRDDHNKKRSKATEEGESNDTKHSKQADTGAKTITPNKEPLSRPRRKWLSCNNMRRRTNDEIHSTIDLDPLMCLIIDTPHFQRLRDLKQLGVTDRVYMNCNHTRFEHSCGVAHLAERLMKRIHQNQAQLNITPKDIMCVKLAGLLHDLGHGPYSHMYEAFLHDSLPQHLRENPQLQQSPLYMTASGSDPTRRWSHEEASLHLIDSLLRHLGLEIDLTRLDEPLKEVGDNSEHYDAQSIRVGDACDCASLSCTQLLEEEAAGTAAATATLGREWQFVQHDGVLTSRDFVFIKECVFGKPIPEVEKALGKEGFHGRPPESYKQWMYDIVANGHSGLDVDRIDYYARDERRAMRAAGEIDKVMIDEACVAWGDCDDPKCKRHSRPGQNGKRQHLMVCYPEKLIGASIGFFRKRFELFSKIYMHKTSVGASFMIRDIFCHADPFVPLPSVKFGQLPLSRAMHDPELYRTVDDTILRTITFHGGGNATTTIEGDNDDDNMMAAVELRKLRELFLRFRSHNFYKCVYKYVLDPSISHEKRLWSLSEHEIKSRMVQESTATDVDKFASTLIVERCNIHHGSKDENPLTRMRFLHDYKRKESDLKKPIEALPLAEAVDDEKMRKYKTHLPQSFQEVSIRVYSRDPNFDDYDGIKSIFKRVLLNVKSEMEEENCPSEEYSKPAAVVDNAVHEICPTTPLPEHLSQVSVGTTCEGTTCSNLGIKDRRRKKVPIPSFAGNVPCSP